MRKTIKQLVIDTCIAEGAFPPEDKLTALVMKHFPDSRWKRSHYTWYRSKIRNGHINVPGISLRDADDELAEEVEDSIEASLSLERDLHSYLSKKVDEIESGLKLVKNGSEYVTEAGRVDLLAKDPTGRSVVIELKAGKAGDAALGQLLGYMGSVSTPPDTVRGILVASDFDRRVVLGAKRLEGVKLIKYQVSFVLQEIS